MEHAERRSMIAEQLVNLKRIDIKILCYILDVLLLLKKIFDMHM
jgi:hypothetical protein